MAWFVDLLLRVFKFSIDEVLLIYMNTTKFIIEEKDQAVSLYVYPHITDGYKLRIGLLCIYLIRLIIKEKGGQRIGEPIKTNSDKEILYN